MGRSVGLGWHALFTWSSSETRTYVVPSLMNLPMSLSTQLYEQAEPSAGLTLDQPAGLPLLISIDQMPLAADGMTITLDLTKSVELSMVPDHTTNTYYQFNVEELVPNDPTTPTALTYRAVGDGAERHLCRGPRLHDPGSLHRRRVPDDRDR